MTNYTHLAEEIEELLEDPIPEGRSQDEEDEDETSSDE